VVLDDVKLIQQGYVGRRNLCDEQVWIIGKKRIGGRLESLGRLFCGQGFQNSHLEPYAVLLDHFHTRRKGVYATAPQSLGRAFQEGRLQGARLQT
jgi:hypothetical protein